MFYFSLLHVTRIGEQNTVKTHCGSERMKIPNKFSLAPTHMHLCGMFDDKKKSFRIESSSGSFNFYNAELEK